MDVVATAYPLHEAVAAIGGKRVHSTHLRPDAGLSSEPLSAKDESSLRNAALVLLPGRGLQPEIESVVADGGPSTYRLLDHFGPSGNGSVEGRDPAVWLDPNSFGEVIDQVRLALVSLDPAGAGYYAKNARNYGRRVAGVDRKFAHRLTGCDRTTLVTAQPGFSYLTKRYGLQRLSAQPGGSSESDLDQLAAATRNAGATTMFLSELPPPDVAGALFQRYGVRSAVLDTLFDRSDLARRGGASYATTMGLNLDALTEALGCHDSADRK